MGTMIQRYKLGEAQYRGSRFADFAHDIKGNNELLVLTQPQVVRRSTSNTWPRAPASSKPTFGATRVAEADYRMEHLAHEMNVAAARLAAAACAIRPASAAVRRRPSARRRRPHP
jgi:5-methyltetrahydrofolate--homocysteine methyltransferase